ncbi:MAG: pitrilysin family protein, partial [Gammaproteobacteria bacterium]
MSAKTWIVAILFALCSVAQAGPRIEQWQTQNGARVYFVAAPELPMVDVRVVFDAGSARDGDNPGLAALTNGLLDEGAKTAEDELNADQIAERFADLGAQFGGGVDRDMASVSLRSLTQPELLQPALQTIAAILTQPTFPQNGFEREQNRVLTNLQAQEQSPGEIAGKTFFKAVYGEHPYATQALGNPESIKQLSRDDLTAFHQHYYVARNAVVAIVGAVTRKEAEGIAETLAGKLPEGEAAPELPQVQALDAGRTIEIAHPSAQTHILAGQPGI